MIFEITPSKWKTNQQSLNSLEYTQDCELFLEYTQDCANYVIVTMKKNTSITQQPLFYLSGLIRVSEPQRRMRLNVPNWKSTQFF